MQRASRNDNRHRQLHRPVATAVAMALAVGGCSTGTTADAAATDPPTAVTSTSPAPAGPPTTDDAASPLDAPLLTQQFAPVDEGTWRIVRLGTEFEVDIEGDWMVQPNESGHVVLTDPESRGPGDVDVVFLRPTALVDPTDPEAGDQWPVDDLDGWLEAADVEVVAGPDDTAVGGAEGIVFELETAGARPVQFLANDGGGGKELYGGDRYVVHWLDQGEHEPIAIVVGANAADIDDWRAVADSLLATVRFGEPAAHPAA